MNEVVAGTAVLSGAVFGLVWAVRQAFDIPGRAVPLLAIILGTAFYLAAYRCSGGRDFGANHACM